MAKLIKQAKMLLLFSFCIVIVELCLSTAVVQNMIENIQPTDEQVLWYATLFQLFIVLTFSILSILFISGAAKLRRNGLGAATMFWLAGVAFFLSGLKLFYTDTGVSVALLMIISATYYRLQDDYAHFVLGSHERVEEDDAAELVAGTHAQGAAEVAKPEEDVQTDRPAVYEEGVHVIVAQKAARNNIVVQVTRGKAAMQREHEPIIITAESLEE